MMYTRLISKYFGFAANCLYSARASPMFWDYESRKLKLNESRLRRLQVRVMVFLHAVFSGFVSVNYIYKLKTEKTRLNETYLLFVPLICTSCSGYQLAVIEILDAHRNIVEVFNEGARLYGCIHGNELYPAYRERSLGFAS